MPEDLEPSEMKFESVTPVGLETEQTAKNYRFVDLVISRESSAVLFNPQIKALRVSELRLVFSAIKSLSICPPSSDLADILRCLHDHAPNLRYLEVFITSHFADTAGFNGSKGCTSHVRLPVALRELRLGISIEPDNKDAQSIAALDVHRIPFTTIEFPFSKRSKRPASNTFRKILQRLKNVKFQHYAMRVVRFYLTGSSNTASAEEDALTDLWRKRVEGKASGGRGMPHLYVAAPDYDKSIVDGKVFQGNRLHAVYRKWLSRDNEL